jgi:putative ABC transport system permease protein
VKDFHNRSFKSEIQPVVLASGRGNLQRVAVKVTPGDMQALLAFMEETWNKFVNRPFEYSFFDEDFDNLYKTEERLGEIFTFFTALAIFISALGIFGLAAFNAEQRTKEIGIRKVVGASVHSIVGLLSIRYIKLLIIANLLAWPIAYFAMNKWLQDFAYHIDLGFVIFGLTGLIALFIVLLSVSSNAISAALANPVVSLKHE